MKKLFKFNFFLLLATFFQINVQAQQIITIPIETQGNSMVLQTDKAGRLGYYVRQYRPRPCCYF